MDAVSRKQSQALQFRYTAEKRASLGLSLLEVLEQYTLKLIIYIKL